MMARYLLDSPNHYIRRGDRIAQIVVSPVMVLAKVVDELDDTDRGAGGFGSTGV